MREILKTLAVGAVAGIAVTGILRRLPVGFGGRHLPHNFF